MESKFRQNTFNQHILGTHMPTCTHGMQRRNTLPGHVPHQDDHLRSQQLSKHHTTQHQTMLHYQQLLVPRRVLLLASPAQFILHESVTPIFKLQPSNPNNGCHLRLFNAFKATYKQDQIKLAVHSTYSKIRASLRHFQTQYKKYI